MALPGLRMTKRSLLLRKSVSTCTIIIYIHTCIVALTQHYLYVIFFFHLASPLLYCLRNFSIVDTVRGGS